MRVKGLDADLIAITGDLVDGSVAELAAHTAPLATLRARHGVFFVTGNHEYYSGADPWIAEIRRLGFRVLLNEHVVSESRRARRRPRRRDDYSAHHFDPAHRRTRQARSRRAPARGRVLLAHQPRRRSAAARPASTSSCRATRTAARSGRGTTSCRCSSRSRRAAPPGKAGVYVSRGTGYWGPPMRLARRRRSRTSGSYLGYSIGLAAAAASAPTPA